jgi:hypothetical protein
MNLRLFKGFIFIVSGIALLLWGLFANHPAVQAFAPKYTPEGRDWRAYASVLIISVALIAYGIFEIRFSHRASNTSLNRGTDQDAN